MPGRGLPCIEMPGDWATSAPDDHRCSTTRGWDFRAIFTAIPLSEPETGRMIGAMATFVDITSRKRVDAQLEESEALFHSLFGQVPIGLGIGDPDVI